MRVPLSRRALIQLMGGLPWLGLAPKVWAFGDTARFIPAVAEHRGRWNLRMSGLRRLAYEIQQRTSVETLPEARAFSLSSAKLFEYPFLYLGGEGELPALKSDEVENLRRYLTFGGFILADANDASDNRGFDASFRREMARVLPEHSIKPLPMDHVVFKSFYLLDLAPGRLLIKPHLEAIRLGTRVAVIYSQNDLAGAWSRDEGGGYQFEVSPGGEPQRELAFRLGVNICMYALCLDYKDDAVHLPLILNRTR